MSRLTNCCECDGGCVPVPPSWTLLPEETTTATATEFGVVRLNAAGQSAVTGENDLPMIVADVLLSLGVLTNPFHVRSVFTSSTIEVPLWCDSAGHSAGAIVRLRIEPGPKFTARNFTNIGGPAQGQGVAPAMPQSHVVTFDLPSIYAGSTYNDFAMKSVSVFVELVVDGTVAQSVLVPTLATTDNWTRGVPGGTDQGVGLQVFAAYEDGQLDVSVRVLNTFVVEGAGGLTGTWDFPPDLPAYTEGIFPLYWGSDPRFDIVATGVKGFAHWHVFETQPVAFQHAHAAISVPRMDPVSGSVFLNTSITQPFVRGIIRNYTIKSVHTPLIPSDESVFCDATSDGYIDPATSPESDNYIAPQFRPENPNLYPWYHTPCTKWARGSRITNAKSASPQLSALTINFSNASAYSNALFFPHYYGAQAIAEALDEAFELTGAKSGQALIDNTFWYEDTPSVEVDSYTVSALSLSARISVQTGTVDPNVNHSRPPCPDSNWPVRVAIDIAALVQSGGQSWMLCGGIVLNSGLNAGLLRGQQSPTQSVSFQLTKDSWEPFPGAGLDQYVSFSADVSLLLA